MKRASLVLCLACTLVLVLGLAVAANAEHHEKALIADALSAAPSAVTENATVKTADGEVLREGSNGWTCYPGSSVIGPMCNRPQWDGLLGALMSQAPFEPEEFSISYMLAGEGEALGVSNSDPFASGPTEDNDWVKEGPHLMIIVPDTAAFEGLSTDPTDPVYVMWKGTPYAHIMVKISAEE